MSAEAKAAFIEAAEIVSKIKDSVLGLREWRYDACRRIEATLRQRAEAEPAEAEREALAETLRAVLTWAEQRCPCENEEPNPCPLCGASIENLEGCKSAENTLPRYLLERLRAAAALSATPKSEGKP